jgi:hypothetical protein
MAKRKSLKSGKNDFQACSIKTLPEEILIEASETAVFINPANAVAIMAALGFGFTMLPPAYIAAITSKYWGPKVMLTVGFMESITDEIANRIIGYMNRWKDRGASVLFTRTKTDPQVRITRSGDGYWSYLGTDILHVPKNQPTMCLSGITMRTSDAECERVIVHEAGHTLSFPHEHMRRDLVQLLDREKTIAEFMRTQGWSRQEVINQVLTPLDEASLMSTPVDQDSLMCYQIPGNCTKSGQPIKGGSRLSESDWTFAARSYPPSTGPIDPPPTARRLVVEFTGDYRVLTA